MSEFRELLHKWAVRQLDTRSDHKGAEFTIESVRVEAVHGYSVAADELRVNIEFTHTGCSYVRPYDGQRCDGEQFWCMPDTTDSVTMLNELLALGDAP